MKIFLDGIEYRVTAEQEQKLLEQLNAMGADMYEKQGLELQLLGSALANWILNKWARAIKKAKGPEAALAIRTPKKADPVLHLSKLFAGIFGKVLEHAELTITTDGAGTAQSCQLQLQTPENQGGGSLVLNGDIGQREDDGAQVPGRGVLPALPADAPLRA